MNRDDSLHALAALNQQLRRSLVACQERAQRLARRLERELADETAKNIRLTRRVDRLEQEREATHETPE